MLSNKNQNSIYVRQKIDGVKVTIMKTLKVLHICLTGTYTDGLNYQDNCIPKYHAKKFKTYLITNQFILSEGKILKTSEIDYVNDNGVHIIRLKGIFSFLPLKVSFYIGKYKKFAKTLNKIIPDIIFIHNVQFNDIRFIARYAKNNCNVVIYVDNHSDFSNSGTNFISRLLLRTEWRRCAQIIEPYTNKFYGVLPARVDFLVNVFRLPQNKCELLVMGADDELVNKVDEKTRSSVREKYNIKDNDFLIVTGGKFDQYKTQIVNLLEAVHKIGDPKIKLIIFGSIINSLKVKIETLVDRKKVFYEPWLNSEQSYAYFGAADLAVFPGRHSVYWEQAAGQGIPLVCKYWDGTTHVDCGGNAIFLKENTAEELKDVLNRLLEHPEEYRQMKSIAINKAMKVFSYEEISTRCLS
jgi:glycosyltransferase involved in cell wall biosynthesis